MSNSNIITQLASSQIRTCACYLGITLENLRHEFDCNRVFVNINEPKDIEKRHVFKILQAHNLPLKWSKYMYKSGIERYNLEEASRELLGERNYYSTYKTMMSYFNIVSHTMGKFAYMYGKDIVSSPSVSMNIRYTCEILERMCLIASSNSLDLMILDIPYDDNLNDYVPNYGILEQSEKLDFLEYLKVRKYEEWIPYEMTIESKCDMFDHMVSYSDCLVCPRVLKFGCNGIDSISREVKK